MSMKTDVESLLQKNGYHDVIFTNGKDPKCSGVVPTIQKLVSSSDRYNRSEEKDYCVMVIGVPNVGKSSLINVLRTKYIGKGNAAKVGGVAGITRSVQNKIRVSENPLIYLMDTPGSGYIHRPNLSFAANYFLKSFRNGELGNLVLDNDLKFSNGSVYGSGVKNVTQFQKHKLLITATNRKKDDIHIKKGYYTAFTGNLDLSIPQDDRNNTNRICCICSLSAVSSVRVSTSLRMSGTFIICWTGATRRSVSWSFLQRGSRPHH
ncbi:hypothetical protein C0J52_07504 [Blattella germanica]|nr:hypothetical protein C0J52_07504 [Blattella germanica]